MRKKYYGPDFNELPEQIRDRIRVAVKSAEESRGLGLIVSERTKEEGSNTIWKNFGSAREVFVYDFGHLHRAYFRTKDHVFSLSFCGSSSRSEKEQIEEALGLVVVKRPKHNQDEADIRIGSETLETIAGLGHTPEDSAKQTYNYQACASGPYMARK